MNETPEDKPIGVIKLTLTWLWEGVLYTLRAILWMIVILLCAVLAVSTTYWYLNTTCIPAEGQPLVCVFTDSERMLE